MFIIIIAEHIHENKLFFFTTKTPLKEAPNLKYKTELCDSVPFHSM